MHLRIHRAQSPIRAALTLSSSVFPSLFCLGCWTLRPQRWRLRKPSVIGASHHMQYCNARRWHNVQVRHIDGDAHLPPFLQFIENEMQLVDPTPRISRKRSRSLYRIRGLRPVVRFSFPAALLGESASALGDHPNLNIVPNFHVLGVYLVRRVYAADL